MSLKGLLGVLVVAVLLCSFACSRKIIAQQDLDQRLIAAIENNQDAAKPVTVRLKDLTTFEWDRFYVFGPYMRPEQVREILGIDWNPETTITYQDWDDLLVFVNKGKVVHYHDHPRAHGDFYELPGRAGYTPEEAVYEVSMDRPLGWLVLRRSKSSKSLAGK